MSVDGAVDLVGAFRGEVDGQLGGLPRLDRLRLLLDALALDLERVVDAAVVRDLEGRRSRLIDLDREGIELELALPDRDCLAPACGLSRPRLARARAAGGEGQSREKRKTGNEREALDQVASSLK